MNLQPILAILYYYIFTYYTLVHIKPKMSLNNKINKYLPMFDKKNFVISKCLNF